jgi:uncharacterized protein
MMKLNQPVKVKVLEVDVARKRISLSIKQTEPAPAHSGGASKRGGGAPLKPAVAVKEPQAPATMQDALAALKNKFGGK